MLLDIDKLTKIESKPNSPINYTKDQLLAQLNLKEFDKNEVIEKPEEIKYSRDKSRAKPEFKLPENKPKIRGKRLFKACAWSILQIFWLYKVVKNYR